VAIHANNFGNRMGSGPHPPRAFTKLWLSISSYFTLNRHASHKDRRFLNQNLLLLFWIRKIVLPQAHFFEPKVTLALLGIAPRTIKIPS
jgi:hypothetical protein